MNANLEIARRVEYGDFQTPAGLAKAVCRKLAGERPATILEPTCGTGAFLKAARSRFPGVRRVLGFDVLPRYVAAARQCTLNDAKSVDCTIRCADFFRTDWHELFGKIPEPIMIIGNPPWVTNAALGVLGSGNHPPKENRQKLSGLDALTGKSNFDVSEWMIARLLEALAPRRGTLAMLCKTAVAQKVLANAWKRELPLERVEVYRIDAARHFGARVDAGLLVCRTCSDVKNGPPAAECRVFDDLESRAPSRTFGLRDGRLVADVHAYERVRHLIGGAYRWRSGVKHDCADVFELTSDGSGLKNGLGERVDLESRFVFPLLKSSQVASAQIAATPRRILLPQRRIGEGTSAIAHRAPKTWDYLLRHAERLDRRASSVYRNRPRFSIFGVGPYTFSRWKVTVSGLYKNWRFAAVGPLYRRPVICDDTCYFLPCRNAHEAHSRADFLNAERARELLSALVFPEAKRPITAEVLGSINLNALAGESK